MKLTENEKNLLNGFKTCLTCLKQLTEKQFKKKQIRCKKCQREYETIWPTTPEFYDMFKDQM